MIWSYVLLESCGVLLLTALAVYGVHRPYWSYYYVHFVASLSWISAVWLAGRVFVFSAGAARERRMDLHGANRVGVSRGCQGDS